MTLLLAFLLCIASAEEPGPTPAAPPAAPSTEEARAKELYQNGSRLYDEGLYEDAIVAFQEAYRLSSKPGLLYNIANAYERLGNLQQAVDALNRYRAFARPDERDALERRIATMERRIDEQAAAAPEPVAPPVVAPPPAEPVAPTEPPRRRSRTAPLVWTGAAMGVGFGAVSGVTYAAGLNKRDSHDRQAYEGIRTWNNASLGLAVAGASLAGVGLVIGTQIDAPLVIAPGRVTLQGRF